jgi:hypothetical protein
VVFGTGFCRVKRPKKSIGGPAADDTYFADAAFEGALGSFKLENHSTGDNAALDEPLDFFAGNSGKDFFSVEDTGDVGEINQLVGTEKFSASGGHMIGVDVVQLIIGTEAEAGSDGHEVFTPERFDKSVVQACEVTDKTEAAWYFTVGHWLGKKTLGIGSGDANGGIAFRGDGGGKSLVQQSGENHDSGVARIAVGDAQAGDKFAFDAHALQGFGEGAAAAMHNENLVAFEGQGRDLTRQRADRGVVFEQSSSELYDGSH